MNFNTRSGPKVLGVTLARAGSKGVPGKNSRKLRGRPLLAYTVEEALKSQVLSQYVFSTDSEKIRQTASSYGAYAPFLRPDNLSTDTATSVDALAHAVEWMETQHRLKYDFVVELMVTNPLKTVMDIDSCIRLLMETGADSVIAVAEVGDFHPARIKRIEHGRLVDFCVPEELESRRQDLLPKAFIRAGSIYAMRRQELMVNRRRYGSDFSVPYILPKERAINIDDEFDWVLAEHLISRRSGEVE